MLGSILNTQYLQVARQALTGLSRREEAIASNIANIDTPGYQRKVVTFEDALKAELAPSGGSGAPGTAGASGAGGGSGASGTGSLPLTRTDPRHMTGTQTSALNDSSIGGVQAQDVIASKNDSNNVDIDQEMTDLVDTQLRYQALSQTLGTRLQTLRTVINGQ
jgi:flagellar basal-body rod protein FlgB